MKYTVFLRLIASGLAIQPWTEDALTFHLKRRLPAMLRNLSPVIARHLLFTLPQAQTPLSEDIENSLNECPEFSLVWRHAQKHNTWPQHVLDSAAFKPSEPFQYLGLPEISSEGDLAEWLNLDEMQLVRFADLKELSNRAENVFAPHYNIHRIPKSDGSLRLIEEPKPVLKRLQRRVLNVLLEKVPVSPSAFGFVTGKSCIQSAARHAGEDVVLNFDLNNFFTSISIGRVSGIFRSFGYPSRVAHLLAAICTVRTPSHIRSTRGLADVDNLSIRHLPQGAPTSPALSNLCSYNLDRRLEGLAQYYNANYSRYADDLTFSGDRSIVKPIMNLMPQLAQSEGFKLNEKKTRTRYQHQQQVSTGIVINEKVNVSRKKYDFLKSSIHHLGSHKDAVDFQHRLLRLSSQIAWVEQINPAKGYKLRTRLEAALK